LFFNLFSLNLSFSTSLSNQFGKAPKTPTTPTKQIEKAEYKLSMIKIIEFHVI